MDYPITEINLCVSILVVKLLKYPMQSEQNRPYSGQEFLGCVRFTENE